MNNADSFNGSQMPRIVDPSPLKTQRNKSNSKLNLLKKGLNATT